MPFSAQIDNNGDMEGIESTISRSRGNLPPPAPRQNDTKVVKSDGKSDGFVADDVCEGNQMSQLDSCANVT